MGTKPLCSPLRHHPLALHRCSAFCGGGGAPCPWPQRVAVERFKNTLVSKNVTTLSLNDVYMYRCVPVVVGISSFVQIAPTHAFLPGGPDEAMVSWIFLVAAVGPAHAARRPPRTAKRRASVVGPHHGRAQTRRGQRSQTMDFLNWTI